MIPHHLADLQVHRGVSWEVFDEACTSGFGFVALSDSHSGFSGTYSEGLFDLRSRGRDRAAINEPTRARRMWALTGDRIEIDEGKMA